MPTINPKVVDLSHYDDVQDGFVGAFKFGIRGVINKVTDGAYFTNHSGPTITALTALAQGVIQPWWQANGYSSTIGAADVQAAGLS